MSNETLTFEQAMKELEQIVHKLEEGNVPLEEAITYYQKGMQLSNYCNEKLKNVEGQLTKMVSEDGTQKDFLVNEEE